MNRFFLLACLLTCAACSRDSGSSNVPDLLTPHPRLAADYFQKTDNFEIPHHAGLLVGQFVKDKDDAALKLPRAWRAVYTTYALETEVGNGGFASFFSDSGGKLDGATEEDLTYIGATPFVTLFHDAREAYYNGAKKSPTDRQKALERLDAQYLLQTKRISDFLRDFMKSHQSLFTE